MANGYFEDKQFFFQSQAKGLDQATFSVVSFTGEEGISKLYRFEIKLISNRADIDQDAVLDSPATLYLKGDQTLPVHGILDRFEQLNEIDGNYYYRAVLVPSLWLLTLYNASEIFLDTTIPELIETVLQKGGLKKNDYEVALQNPAGYRRWSYLCQYQESLFDFLSRRMEREGIYYYFEQKDDKEKLIITDTDFKHVDLPGESKVHYSPPSGLDSQVQQEVATAFVIRRQTLPAKVILQDFNFRNIPPRVHGEATISKTGRGEIHIYGEHVKSSVEAEQYAKIRAQEILCRQKIGYGESTAPFLCSGFHFDLDGHYQPDSNQKYLLTSVQHKGSQAALFLSGDGLALSGEETHPYYRNSFEAILAGVQFRPERTTPRPNFSGTINAKIEADGDGQYAEIDPFGRYKVKLPFDRSDRRGQKASRWVRMAQPYQGPDEGMHFPLRKGAEVLLTFVDGNPDRPVIAGAVPGAEGQSPVINENATKNMIKTAGGNQMHMEDHLGRQRILMRSPTVDSWMRIGYPNDPPIPYRAKVGETIDHYSDPDGSWTLYTPSAGFEVTADDDGKEITFALDEIKQYVVKCNKKETLEEEKSESKVDDDGWGYYSSYQKFKTVYTYTVAVPSSGSDVQLCVKTVTQTKHWEDFSEKPWKHGTPPRWVDTKEEGKIPEAGDEFTFDNYVHKLESTVKLKGNDQEECKFKRLYRMPISVIDMRDTEYRKGVRIHSEGNYWLEALDRHADYIVGRPAKGPERKSDEIDKGHSPKIGNLLEDIGSTVLPTGLAPRYPADVQKGNSGDDDDGKFDLNKAVAAGIVHVSSLDTFTIHKGNRYDFGGYWNYNLGNSYSETLMDPKGQLNKKHDNDRADAGGPDYKSIKDLDDQGSNIWVNKTIGGATYDYENEVHHLEVLNNCHTTIHSHNSHEEIFKYSGAGVKTYHKKDLGGGNSTEQRYDRNTKDLMEDTYTSRPGGGLFKYHFVFCAKAIYEFEFGFATSFKLHSTAELNLKLNIDAHTNINLKNGYDFALDSFLGAKIGITANWAFRADVKAGIGLWVESDLRIGAKATTKLFPPKVKFETVGIATEFLNCLGVTKRLTCIQDEELKLRNAGLTADVIDALKVTL